jgi:SAM-dependent methyltransferase
MINKVHKYISKFLPQSKSFCSLCDKTGLGFIPLPDFYRDNAQKYGYPYFGKGEMTALDTYSCAHCGASDRERLYAYWIKNELQSRNSIENLRVIHFAPEAILSSKLKTLNLAIYHMADLMMEGCDYKVDMMNMPFEADSYDFFICSHVLEHVESDDKAIAELYRITKKGGCGILMAPIIVGLQYTLEDPSITDEAGRWRHFGQNDHVRLYAHDDYVTKIQNHGFSVQELSQKHFGKKIFSRLGLKSTSILYVVSK